MHTNKDGYMTGINKNNDGTFTAITRVESKEFKTERGAINWITRRGYNEDGTKSYS